MPSTVEQLSPRERHILSLAAKGLTDKEIAVRCGVSLTTVRTYWERLRQKTGASNRAMAVALYVRGTMAGIPDIPDTTPEPNTLLAAAVDAMIGGVLVIDGDQIIAANDKACALLNFAPGTLEGTSIGKIITSRNEAFHHALRVVHAEGGQASITVSVFMKQRLAHDLLASATIRAIETPDGHVTAIFFHDLTEEIDARRRGLHVGSSAF